MSVLNELKAIIQEESEALLCETHPQACRLRDDNYAHFEALVLDLIFQEEEPVSVQSALAELERELGESLL